MVVEIFTPEECVSIGGLDLKHTLLNLQDGNIECSTTQVKHSYSVRHTTVILIRKERRRGQAHSAEINNTTAKTTTKDCIVAFMKGKLHNYHNHLIIILTLSQNNAIHIYDRKYQHKLLLLYFPTNTKNITFKIEHTAWKFAENKLPSFQRRVPVYARIFYLMMPTALQIVYITYLSVCLRINACTWKHLMIE